MTWVHPPDCRGDCCHYDQLTDEFLTDDALWATPTRDRLDHLRKTSRPSTPAAANPDST
jgi:hypothetical protein